jgi:uncharacterized protein (TIGR03086 family)
MDEIAAQVESLAAKVTDDQLDRPTPCSEFTVADLLAHLLGLSRAFRDAANKANGASQSPPPPMALPADWRSALPARLAELVDAWRRPEAVEGMTRAGGLELPGAVARKVAIDELVLHGWDLAVATRQEFAPQDAALDECLAVRGDGGIFGPVVPVAADAPKFDKVLGLSGRDPNWQPTRR